MLGHFFAATKADIDQILAIEEHAFERPWSRTSFLEELSRQDAFHYVVKSHSSCDHGQLIAYIFFRLIADEIHLLKIAVAPNWRRRGVAFEILEKCFLLASGKGAAVAFLEVRTSNISAISLYQKLGFQTVGKRPNYYSGAREDALVMMKNLKEEL